MKDKITEKVLEKFYYKQKNNNQELFTITLLRLELIVEETIQETRKEFLEKLESFEKKIKKSRKEVNKTWALEGNNFHLGYRNGLDEVIGGLKSLKKKIGDK